MSGDGASERDHGVARGAPPAVADDGDGDGNRANGGGGPPDIRETSTADRMTAALTELYGSDLEEFTDRRQALAAAAKTAGDKAAATAIAALRKPTRAAWVVNRLARCQPAAPPRLAALAAGLRAAEQAKDGARLRELSLARGTLLDALTEQALTAAGFPDPPPSLRAEVEATLTAALADRAVAKAFAAGTLTRAAHWSGFGDASLGPEDPAIAGPPAAGSALVRARSTPAGQQHPWPTDPVEVPAGHPATPRAPLTAVPATAVPATAVPATAVPATAVPATAVPAPAVPAALVVPATEVPATAGARRRPTAPVTTRRGSRPSATRGTVTRGRVDDDQRSTQEAAERAAHRQKNYQDAERTVASAVTTAAEAQAGEDRLEAEVRDLEERLVQARADLVAARLSARRAEAAERRARQALDRLPRA